MGCCQPWGCNGPALLYPEVWPQRFRQWSHWWWQSQRPQRCSQRPGKRTPVREEKGWGVRVNKWRGWEAGQTKVHFPVRWGPLLSLGDWEECVLCRSDDIPQNGVHWGGTVSVTGSRGWGMTWVWGQKGRCESHHRWFPKVGGREALSPLQGEARRGVTWLCLAFTTALIKELSSPTQRGGSGTRSCWQGHAARKCPREQGSEPTGFWLQSPLEVSKHFKNGGNLLKHSSVCRTSEWCEDWHAVTPLSYALGVPQPVAMGRGGPRSRRRSVSSWGPGAVWGGLAPGVRCWVVCGWGDQAVMERLKPCFQLAAGAEPWPAVGAMSLGSRQGWQLA